MVGEKLELGRHLIGVVIMNDGVDDQFAYGELVPLRFVLTERIADFGFYTVFNLQTVEQTVSCL